MIEDTGRIDFSVDDVPTEYCWSGYAREINKYISANFSCIKYESHSVYLCSFDNAVALGEYLSRFIIKQCFINDMESVLSPGYDYWFFKAFEQCASNYYDLDDWVHSIIDYFIENGMIKKMKKDDSELFVLIDFDKFETAGLPNEMISDLGTICEESLYSYFQQQMDDYGSLKEISLGEGGSWAEGIFHKFVLDHTTQ